MHVFFSYGLVLTTFHGVPEQTTGLYLLPLAASNFFGPVLLAPLFDTVGRRKMICGTYGAAGLLLLATAVLLSFDVFTAWTQTLAWMVIFFFASAAASSAGGARPCDRDILCHRHCRRGSGRSFAVRISDWIGRHRGGGRWLRGGSRADADCGGCGIQIRDRCGGAFSRKHRRAAFKRVTSQPEPFPSSSAEEASLGTE
jgi:MFS family permease